MNQEQLLEAAKAAVAIYNTYAIVAASALFAALIGLVHSARHAQNIWKENREDPNFITSDKMLFAFLLNLVLVIVCALLVSVVLDCVRESIFAEQAPLGWAMRRMCNALF
jgi:uncharacterized BrkB/YihY/UPF0761 family membrane protein